MCIRDSIRNISYNSVPEKCRTRLSCKRVPQECLASGSHKRASSKIVTRKCPTCVGHKALEEFCARLPYRNVSPETALQECLRRVSDKNVKQRLFLRTRVHLGLCVSCGYFPTSSSCVAQEWRGQPQCPTSVALTTEAQHVHHPDGSEAMRGDAALWCLQFFKGVGQKSRLFPMV